MQLTGEYKKFDPTLFLENDAKCRAAVLSYGSSLGLYLTENPDKYGPDLILYRGLRPVAYIEVERKNVWKAGQDSFPWSEINLPERKAKFLTLGLPVEFWILREDFLMAVVLPDYVVQESPLVEVPNKYTEKGEFFFKINVKDCDLVELSVHDKKKT